MLDTNKESYDEVDLQLTQLWEHDAGALLAQSMLREVLRSRYPGHTGRVFRQVLLSLYNSCRYPLDLQSVGTLCLAESDQALALVKECLQNQREPHTYFEQGTLLFAVVLPRWGQNTVSGTLTDQQTFLREAMKTLKWTREQLSEALGCSKRGLDKWLLPTESQDFRGMGPAAEARVKALLKLSTVDSGSLLPENSVLAMGLACKAFDMMGHHQFTVSAALSVDNPEGLKTFGKFQQILVMAYNEGAANARLPD